MATHAYQPAHRPAEQWQYTFWPITLPTPHWLDRIPHHRRWITRLNLTLSSLGLIRMRCAHCKRWPRDHADEPC